MTFVMSQAILQHPFTCSVAGPTGCGKTQFTMKLIENRASMIYPVPSKVIWYYGIHQSLFERRRNIDFREGLPKLEEFDGTSSTLIILDDLMHEVNDDVSRLFTRGSHHRNISVIFLTQNIHHASRHSRTLNLNTHYLILFKNPRDASQIVYLARQMYPSNNRFLVESFRDATAKPYGYLFIDLKPETDESFRVRTGVFPDEINYVYVPK